MIRPLVNHRTNPKVREWLAPPCGRAPPLQLVFPRRVHQHGRAPACPPFRRLLPAAVPTLHIAGAPRPRSLPVLNRRDEALARVSCRRAPWRQSRGTSSPSRGGPRAPKLRSRTTGRAGIRSSPGHPAPTQRPEQPSSKARGGTANVVERWTGVASGGRVMNARGLPSSAASAMTGAAATSLDKACHVGPPRGPAMTPAVVGMPRSIYGGQALCPVGSGRYFRPRPPTARRPRCPRFNVGV